MIDAERLIDALGTYCPVPIALAARAARELPAGAVIELLADDPLIEVDLPAWCHRAGHELVALVEEDGGYRALVRCGTT
ncbi:MAG: sulfurtransferase TusA family protein [Miltoncostaeaceae bacterium]